jgi:hypothetical protein
MAALAIERAMTYVNVLSGFGLARRWLRDRLCSRLKEGDHRASDLSYDIAGYGFGRPAGPL